MKVQVFARLIPCHSLSVLSHSAAASRETEHSAIIYSLNCEPFCTPSPSSSSSQLASSEKGERASAIMAKTILIWVPCMRTFNFSARPQSSLHLGGWTDKEIR